MDNIINNSYEHKLANAYHLIDNRGLLLDHKKLVDVKKAVQKELLDNCAYLTQAWSFPVYIGAENNPDLDGSLNINSPQKVLDKLKELGYKVPKVRKKDEETHEYEFEESVDKLALRKLLTDPVLWPTNITDPDKCIRTLLESKELITFRNRYANARLYKNQYFSSYSVTSTKTGRRSSKKNIFGFGGNSQNFPARGRLSELWKQTIIARPGRIFFFVDQMQAEDWPVQALSENYSALDEMRKGINRHYKFAASIFGRSIDDLKRDRASNDPIIQRNAEMQYYMGKKGRHSNNYGMQGARLSEDLAANGYTVTTQQCNNILVIIDGLDPNVKRIFHQYIHNEVSKSTHTLKTPLGRERQFFGLRSGEKNYNIFNEANAWIPQSLIGDNTGLAVLYLSGCNNFIVQEGHDSIVQELPDSETELLRVLTDTKKAFERTIKFHNGIEIQIPIEGHIGYNWKDKVVINNKGWEFDEDHLIEAYKKLQEQKKEKEPDATTFKEVMA
jgi:hypothetical protein